MPTIGPIIKKDLPKKRVNDLVLKIYVDALIRKYSINENI